MDNSNTYTAYIVRDANNRKYLNAPTYTGRRNECWGRIGESHVFYSATVARSCASNINARAPGSKRATVVAVEMQRLG